MKFILATAAILLSIHVIASVSQPAVLPMPQTHVVRTSFQPFAGQWNVSHGFKSHSEPGASFLFK